MELTLKERNQAVTDLEAVREELRDTREEVSLHVFFFFTFKFHMQHIINLSMARLPNL